MAFFYLELVCTRSSTRERGERARRGRVNDEARLGRGNGRWRGSAVFGAAGALRGRGFGRRSEHGEHERGSEEELGKFG
jgi:hypothetical protein